MENNQAPSKALGIVGLIFGICSLALCWLGFCGGFPGIIPLVLGILAVIFCSKTKTKFAAVGQELGMAKAGFVLGLIGLILSAIFLIIGIIIVCTAGALVAAASQDPSIAADLNNALNELASELSSIG